MTAPEGTLRVFLMHDHELVRRGVRELLEGPGPVLAGPTTYGWPFGSVATSIQ